MGAPAYRRLDVNLVLVDVQHATSRVQNLAELEPHRELSIAITHIQEAENWLTRLSERVPE